MSEIISPDGFRYRIDGTGTIHQVDAVPIKYDSKYIADRYLPEVIPAETLAALGHLRWGHFLGYLREGPRPANVLDWGFGAGWFLRAVTRTAGVKACGYDISGWPIPEWCEFVPHPLLRSWGLVTFFDVLEHIEDLSFLYDLDAKWLVITVPWCPYVDKENNVDWDNFWRWRHRRPNEHLHHWTPRSLQHTLYRFGFDIAHTSSVEDIVRRGPSGHPNILTVTARKI